MCRNSSSRPREANTFFYFNGLEAKLLLRIISPSLLSLVMERKSLSFGTDFRGSKSRKIQVRVCKREVTRMKFRMSDSVVEWRVIKCICDEHRKELLFCLDAVVALLSS